MNALRVPPEPPVVRRLFQCHNNEFSFDLDDQLVGDNPTTAKSLPANQKLKLMETQVAQVKLPNRSGELARATSELGEANVNINYARRQHE